jgi:pathogenesis-related protein 1
MRNNLPLVVVSLVALAACTRTEGDPGFGSPDLGSAEDSGSSVDAGHDDDAVAVGSSDATSPEDATSPVTTARDAGRAETGGEDTGTSDDAQADGPSAGDPETGQLAGITAAHNAVRAMVSTTPALPPLTWSPTLAAYAQAWATQLASSPSTCSNPQHRPQSELMSMDYGENLAAFYGESRGGAPLSTAQQAVDGWASEVMCWTYGTIAGTEKCDMTCYTNLHSDGCGHYTQIVWRNSLQLGCGVATCQTGQGSEDIWICNYSPAGNIEGQAPY